MTKAIRNTVYAVLSIGAIALVLNWPTTASEGSPSPSVSVNIIDESTVPPATEPTTTTSTTSTTTTMPDLSGVDWVALARATYGKCGEWHDLAIQVGWPEEEWPFLQEVIWRESRCTVDAWNGADAGLTQINQVHKKWLADMGWNHPDDMFNAEKNLTFALRLWESSGWKPWRFSGPVPD